MLNRILLFLFSIALCFALPQLGVVQRFDFAAAEFLARHRSEVGDLFFAAFSFLGSSGILLFVVFGLTMAFFMLKRYRAGLYYLISVGSLRLLGAVLKLLIARPRPALGYQVWGTYAMPSGHALNAAIIYASLAFFLGGRMSSAVLKKTLALLCALTIVLVALSRVYLGAHYPSDVVAGVFLGISGMMTLHGWGLLRRDLYKIH